MKPLNPPNRPPSTPPAQLGALATLFSVGMIVAACAKTKSEREDSVLRAKALLRTKNAPWMSAHKET